MRCSACGAANPDDSRFCGACGASLAAPPSCPRCRAPGSPGQRFCNLCGASLAGPAPADDGARKVVTIVFADLVGSTALQERLDAEAVRRFMDRYYAAMRGAVEAHGGTVTQLLGDGVKAVFGAPRVAEDDAIRAVRAAVAMQRAFAELAESQAGAVGHTGLRVAVNTGEVIASEGSEIIGDPVNVAARLQEQARSGDVVIGESTRRLVSELVTLAAVGAVALKGRSAAVGAYRVVSLDRPAGAFATPFVGREGELRRITAVYDDAVAQRRARLAVILGSPGLGKSRAIGEVERRLADAATILTARCDASGAGTFAPLAAALRELLHLADAADGDALRAAIEAQLPAGDDAERSRIVSGIAALVAGTPAPPEETFFVVRRFLGALAAARPVVLAIDDLQWAEPLLLDLCEHLVQWSGDVPLLVLVAARPELRDARSSLAAPGGLVADVVTLAGLDAGAATRLAANVIGADDLPAAVAARVLATSEGNPLFVGELVRMLVHDGALVREGNRWTAGAELAALEMPPTIQALLAARIERLRPEERSVLERAAVVGRQFSRAAVRELLPREATDLDRQIEALRRSELIESDTGWFLGEPALRFHHVLIRDAAYRRLLKNTRAELHARLADWVIARVGDAAPHDETIGWHLEQAHHHLRELGPVDAAGRALGERAATYLAAAGRRALARDDVPVAASLLGRALDRLEPEDSARAELALDWCEALLAAGEVGTAERAIDELGRLAGESARLRAWHTCFVGERAALTDPKSLRSTADAVAASAEQLASEGDTAGEAKAHFVHAIALARLGKVGACEAALDRALAAARRGRGDRRRANAVLAGAPLAALWGPSPVTRASGRCLDVVRVLRITHGSPAVEAVALRCQGVLEALRGRSEAARRMIASSRRMVEELGITHRLLQADQFAGQVELIEGDPVAAERCLRTAYDGMKQLGLGSDAAQAAAMLGRALLAQDRAAEAEALSHESEALAGDDLQSAIAWRGVRAEAQAKRGESAAAIELARAAVELASATDALLFHADARLALAAALRAAGRGAEAAAEETRAIELWEAKGATLLAERARSEGVRVAPAVAPARLAPIDAAGLSPRVRPNAATAACARLQTAVAARDDEGICSAFADSYQHVDHRSGAEWGRDGSIEGLRRLWRAEQPTYRLQPLATLGDSIALTEQSVSASGTPWKQSSIGPFETEELHLYEVGDEGRLSRTESFARQRLGDAVVRMYERYAELLPNGAERERAAATARTVAVLTAPIDPDRFASVASPAIEFIGHGSVAYPAGRGAEQVLRGIRIAFESATDHANRIDDVLALQSDALLLRRTSSGTDRIGGGAYERPQISCYVFGRDGRLIRFEHFEPSRESDALARFDELTAAPSPSARPAGTPAPPPRHRAVFANAAIAIGVRADATVARGDVAGLDALFGESAEVLDHRTGRKFDREQRLSGFRTLLAAARDPVSRHEPLAALGDSLVLSRRMLSASGFAGGTQGTGGYRIEELCVVEVDRDGLTARTDLYAVDRLGDALTRLYERYAEQLPEGRERTRAAAVARSVATVLASLDPDSIASALALDVRYADHRALGWGPAHGVVAFVRALRTLRNALPEVEAQTIELLALRADALLVRRTVLGELNASGDRYRRRPIVLWVFGANGRVTHWEQFDGDQRAEALARFEGLAAPPPPARLLETAATAAVDRLGRAWVSRDWNAVTALFAAEFRYSDRRTLIQLELDREAALEFMRPLFEMRGMRNPQDVLATRGERLALILLHSRFTGSEHELGPSETESLMVVEVDARGDRVAHVRFDPDAREAAYAELDRRYAAGEAIGHPAMWAALWDVRRALAARNWDRLAGLVAPDLVAEDHRLLGWGTVHSAEQYAAALRPLTELQPDVALRMDHLLLRDRTALFVASWIGGKGAGAFEIPVVIVFRANPGGRIDRVHHYTLEQIDAARARLAELEAVPAPSRPVENLATRSIDQFNRAWEMRDLDGAGRVHAAGFVLFDRRSLVSSDADRAGHLETLRVTFELPSSRISSEVLATRGERLALDRVRFEGTGRSIGPSEIEFLSVVEVDERGARIAAAMFDADALEAACAELDARHASGEAAAFPHVAETMRAFREAFARRDWEALAARMAADVVVEDHRLLGWETVRSSSAYVQTLHSLVDLAPDTRLRLDHVEMSQRGLFWIGAWVGTREGGEFETPWITVSEHDARGIVVRFDQYDLNQLADARARFAALRTERE